MRCKCRRHNFTNKSMLLNIIYLIVGLALILYGANILTDGSASIARRFGISDLVVGLTVVAFGTSTPELVISIVSAAEGNAGIAVGNIVGSNIFNVLMIIGVVALIYPIKIKRSIMINEIPIVILSSVVLLVMANGPLLDGSGSPVITRVDGIILLIFFMIFMRYTFASAKREEKSGTPQSDLSRKEMKAWKAWVYVIGGLAALIFGGDRFVAGASALASALGVSEAVIGLTVVASGTSLPELATSVVAARKGETGLAIGNVIGSNIFNIFFVLGASATVAQLPCQGVSQVDLLVMTGSAVIFWVFGWLFKKRTITRAEGAVMLACWIGYTSWLIANAAH